MCKHFMGEAMVCAHCSELAIPHPLAWPDPLPRWLMAEHWRLKLETATPVMLRVDLLLQACRGRTVGIRHKWVATAQDVYPFALDAARTAYPLPETPRVD